MLKKGNDHRSNFQRFRLPIFYLNPSVTSTRQRELPLKDDTQALQRGSTWGRCIIIKPNGSGEMAMCSWSLTAGRVYCFDRLAWTRKRSCHASVTVVLPKAAPACRYQSIIQKVFS